MIKLLALALSALLIGCATRTFYVQAVPPPPVAVQTLPDRPAPLQEVVVAAPVEGGTWQAGYWYWIDRWVWVPGAWYYPAYGWWVPSMGWRATWGYRSWGWGHSGHEVHGRGWR